MSETPANSKERAVSPPLHSLASTLYDLATAGEVTPEVSTPFNSAAGNMQQEALTFRFVSPEAAATEADQPELPRERYIHTVVLSRVTMLDQDNAPTTQQSVMLEVNALESLENGRQKSQRKTYVWEYRPDGKRPMYYFERIGSQAEVIAARVAQDPTDAQLNTREIFVDHASDAAIDGLESLLGSMVEGFATAQTLVSRPHGWFIPTPFMDEGALAHFLARSRQYRPQETVAVVNNYL